MKKALFLLAGVVAVMFAVAPLIPEFNNAVIADPVPAIEGHDGGIMEKLNLTDAQKTQIKQISESSKQQIDAVFTTEQKAQLQQARLQHTRPTLNLSDEQKAQLKQIYSSTQSQMNAVLTPEQHEQIQQLLNQWNQSHRQHSP